MKSFYGAGKSGLRGVRSLRVLRWLSLALFTILALAAVHVVQVRPIAMTLGQRTLFFYTHSDSRMKDVLEAHEAVHREQYRKEGLSSFLWKYIFSPEQRLRWEADAFAAGLCWAHVSGFSAAEVRDMEGSFGESLDSYVPDRNWETARFVQALDKSYRNGSRCVRWTHLLGSEQSEKGSRLLQLSSDGTLGIPHLHPKLPGREAPSNSIPRYLEREIARYADYTE